MDTLPWEAGLMRVYLGEADVWGQHPLYQEIVNEARRRGIAGATVLRGVMGFGASSLTRDEAPSGISGDCPIIIEIIDRRERIGALLADLRGMLSGCLVTIQPVRVPLYRPGSAGE